MAKKKQQVVNKVVKEIEVVNTVVNTEDTVTNGLGSALGIPGSNGVPQGLNGNPGSERLSDSTTIFRNLRFYLVSNFRQLLSQAFVEIGLVKTIVCVPVDDALRGGIVINSSELDEDDIKKLQKFQRRQGDMKKAGWAAKWTRLFGGGGILIMTEQDCETPLDVEALNEDSMLEFRAVDMWELYWSTQNMEGADIDAQPEDYEFYDYYGLRVHKSRVLRMVGDEAPSFVRPRLRGWGVSVVETLVRSINQYLKATDLSFEVLDEFKIDVYKIKNLVNSLLSKSGEEKIRQRVQMSNWTKNYQNAVVMDSEDDFDHKDLSFAGLAEVMTGIRKQVSSDMRMPLTKLFGSSESGGIGNNDQNDMENYNSMVEGTVRDPLEPVLVRMTELRCQQLFGYIPVDLDVGYKPMRVLSATDEETVKTQKFLRVLQAKQGGIITHFESREALNKDNLVEIELDNNGDVLNPDDPQIEGLVTDASLVTDDKDKSADGDDKKDSVKNWEEADHPRADDGKFGEGGSSATAKKSRTGQGKKLTAKPTKEEAGAIEWYTGPLSSSFISADKGKPLDEETSKRNEVLNKFLDKAPKYEGDIFRGIVVEKKELKGILEKYAPGNTIDDGAKQSWTKDGEAVERRLTSVANGKKKPVKLFFDYPKSDVSVDVAEYSSFPAEKEVIVPKGAKYKVKEIVEKDGAYRIVMEPAMAVKNSAEFERASFEADGGEDSFSSSRAAFFDVKDPLYQVDKPLWKRSKEMSQAAYGEEKWQFVVWYYEKQGGKFR